MVNFAKHAGAPGAHERRGAGWKSLCRGRALRYTTKHKLESEIDVHTIAGDTNADANSYGCPYTYCDADTYIHAASNGVPYGLTNSQQYGYARLAR